MSILTVGSWVTKAAGRLFSSGLGLNCPSSSRINLTQPVSHGSLLQERVPQAKADFQVRSYSKLRLLHQEASTLFIGLDCLSNEARQRKKEHDCSHSVVHHSDSGNDMLALPPLSFYLLHFICPVDERPWDNITTLEPETPQPAGGWLAGISASLPSQASIAAVNSMTRGPAVYLDKAGILTLITRIRAGIVPFFTMTRARIETFFNMARAKMVSVFSIARAIITAIISRARDFGLPTPRCWIKTAFYNLFRYVAAAFSRIRRRMAPVLSTARATRAPTGRARLVAGFPETGEEMEGFSPSDYELEPEEETLIPLASLNHQIQRRQQLRVLSSVCSSVFYWRVFGSVMLQPPHLSATPSAFIVNGIQQRSTDRPIVDTSPLHSMDRPIDDQNTPKSNLFALMQAGKDVVFTLTRSVYSLTRKAASSLYGMAWTLRAKLYCIARAVSAEVPGVVRILIVTLNQVVQGAFGALVRTWQILFIMTFACLEATIINIVWGIMADSRFDLIVSLIPVVIMPLIIDITLSRGLEIYQNFTVVLDGVLPDWAVRPVATILTTIQVLNRAQLFAFAIACPLGILITIERNNRLLSVVNDSIYWDITE